MAISPRKLTYEEWLIFPNDDGVRTELIDGEVRVAAEANLRHQVLFGRLFYVIETHLRAHGGGMILPPVNVKLDVDQVFIPDLTFVRDLGEDPLTYHGPPGWVIEIVSDARRDSLKRERYERYGVPEYWAVLPEPKQVQVFLLRGDRYEGPVVYEAGDFVSPGVLPRLEIDLSEIFA